MKHKNPNLLIAIMAALIVASSGCSQSEPAINPEVSTSQSEISASLSQIESESSEPEPEPEPIPEPVVTLSQTEVERGSYMTVFVENIDLTGVVFTDFLGYQRPFLKYGEGFMAFIPVKTAAAAGEYTLSFEAENFTFSETVTVTDRNFPTQYLTVAPQTLEQTLEDKEVRVYFDYFFQKYRFTYTEEILWNGEFILPLGEHPYKETTSFGSFRTFSNGDTEWHNATDMAAPGGTPIYATNSGRVLFADWLGLTGYTVVLDHGMGVLSWHYHLSAMDVAEGDSVEKGQLIGKVGTTGLSTGNHLHFGISVGGIFTDPMALMGKEPISSVQ